VVNTLLTEMDGLEKRGQVFVIGATNRPDIIDRAMLRPGRLNKQLYVELPSPEERYQILQTLGKKFPIEQELSLVEIANDKRCSRFSGADLNALLREAAMSSLKECLAQLNHKPAGELEAIEAMESEPVPEATSSTTPLPAVAPPAETPQEQYVSPLNYLSNAVRVTVAPTTPAATSVPAPSPAPLLSSLSSSSPSVPSPAIGSSQPLQPFREVKTTNEFAVDPKIQRRHFEDAFTKVFPSVSREDERKYEQLKQEMQGKTFKHAETSLFKDRPADGNL